MAAASIEDSPLWAYDYARCAAAAAGQGGKALHHGVLGIDEAGRGSWVGPVVAAAAYIAPEAYLDARLRGGCAGVDDSKKLNRAQRDALFAKIETWHATGLLRVACGQADVAEIEAHNIVGATALAMRRAVAALELPCELPTGQCVKVGGKRAALPAAATSDTMQEEFLNETTGAALPARATSNGINVARTPSSDPNAARATSDGANAAGAASCGTDAADLTTAACASVQSELAWGPAVRTDCSAPAMPPPQVWVDGNPMAKCLPFAHTGLVAGDGTSLAIAVASIWAKVTRDRLLVQLAAQFPHYGWERNAGYGTPAHAAALRTHGVCCHHRPRFLRKQGFLKP